MAAKTGKGVGVGMPAGIKLNQWGCELFDAFGEGAYLVGSATRTKKWRDVDVRVILPDDRFIALFGEKWAGVTNAKWAAWCAAFAARGAEVTGLPIDFQIQSQSHADRVYPTGTREPLGVLTPHYPEAAE